MAKSQVLTGLDIGSGRVTCLVAVRDPGGEALKILGGSVVPCRGLKGGVVVNIAEAARAITQAVEEAEEKSKEAVSQVYLGIRGAHLQSFNNRGAYNIARTDKEITAEDITNVIENAKAIPISNDREIVHVIPQSFSLDRQRGVPNPVGMEGSLLEVEVHIVTASRSHLSNIEKAVNQAGFEIAESVYSLLAVGDLVVSPEEKELGCLLVDMGGQTVSVGIYSEGGIRFSKDLSLGSDFITRDLAFGLRTSLSTAQMIKEKHGVALSAHLNGEEEVAFVGVDGRSPQKASVKALLEFIQPRIEDIFNAVREEVQNSNFADLIVPGGAILTGGGALLKGMPEAGAHILEMPVRLGIARGQFVCGNEEYLNPSYATALGLLGYSTGDFNVQGIGKGKKLAWKKKLSSWFEDLF